MVKKFADYSLQGTAGLGTTGGAVADLSRDGLSYITADETYCLQAPVFGCKKTLVCVSTATAAAATILAATSSGVVTFNQVGHGKISFPAASTEVLTVELVGISSTRWAITNVYPVASTGAGAVTTTY